MLISLLLKLDNKIKKIHVMLVENINHPVNYGLTEVV